jgi:hypothetical protein
VRVYVIDADEQSTTLHNCNSHNLQRSTHRWVVKAEAGAVTPVETVIANVKAAMTHGQQ